MNCFFTYRRETETGKGKGNLSLNLVAGNIGGYRFDFVREYNRKTYFKLYKLYILCSLNTKLKNSICALRQQNASVVVCTLYYSLYRRSARFNAMQTSLFGVSVWRLKSAPEQVHLLNNHRLCPALLSLLCYVERHLQCVTPALPVLFINEISLKLNNSIKKLESWQSPQTI
jgi:hypothetical protein